MKRYASVALAVFGVLGFAQNAGANAGTPLVWAGMLHLVFGNALIGLGEGILLSRLFSVPKRQGVLVMVLANYTSAWLGGLFIRGRIVQALPLDLNNGWKWFWIMVGVTWCLTVILEWPFVARCFRGREHWFRPTVRASLILQSASYVLMFSWYWLASGTSLYTRMTIVNAADLSLPESVLVYFIAPEDGNVYSRHLTKGGQEKIYELRSTNKNDRLFVRPSKAATNRWDLMGRLDSDDRREPHLVEVLTNLLVDAAPDWVSTRTDPPQYRGTWFNVGEAQRLGSATNSDWQVRTGFWAAEGLRAFNKTTSGSVRFAYETPFGAWTVRNAVHLPSDKVLFQLGHYQICLFDPPSRQVALLWHGRGPVPVIAKGHDEQDDVADPDRSFSSGNKSALRQ